MNIEYISTITASDMVTWILALMGGFIAYLVIDHFQTSMERHKVINEIETKLNHLFSSTIAKKVENEEYNTVMVRTVLHDFSPWVFNKNASPLIMDAQRHICIRKDQAYHEYISTQALHESLVLFRRIEKLHKSKIIESIDLSDLWREILPYGTSNRLIFFGNYFSKHDTQSIAYVLMKTVNACKKHKNQPALDYFKNNYKNQEEDIDTYFQDNTRIGAKRKVALKQFFDIVK
ncbi:hypothetical protein [Isachenkonia alkalipeptolytica]|uniref:Uncharacterized protein n=1 Tax=Isachenkonia alkalipeptolytica TaxID=2565777 RepID=A0AA44BEQ6_9CLOT|nr:hypothetical protein [Isachenkonia alkalipeptolytica]NBG89519.1 hypothetical protein [Isachenkonia alkalipeptolytica]